MCSSSHWQVGSELISRKIVSSEQEQRLSRWADLAKNCLPRIECKELPRLREKYRALGRHICKIREIGGQKNRVQHATAIYPNPRCTRPRYIGLTLYWAIPRKDCSSATQVVSGRFNIGSSLSGRGCRPCWSNLNPRYRTSETKNWHLSSRRRKPESWIRCSTASRFFACSSSLRPVTKISSR